MNINYLTIPLLSLNIIFSAFVAQKVFYVNSVDVVTKNEETQGECEIEVAEVKTFVKSPETKSENKNPNWFSDDCETQKMYVLRARDHYRRGLIKPKMAESVADHYEKVCSNLSH